MRVAYEPWGYDEAGLYLFGEYADLDSTIEAVERFLGLPLLEWENYTRSGGYPPEPIRRELCFDRLRADFAARILPVPDGATYL